MSTLLDLLRNYQGTHLEKTARLVLDVDSHQRDPFSDFSSEGNLPSQVNQLINAFPDNFIDEKDYRAISQIIAQDLGAPVVSYNAFLDLASDLKTKGFLRGKRIAVPKQSSLDEDQSVSLDKISPQFQAIAQVVLDIYRLNQNLGNRELEINSELIHDVKRLLEFPMWEVNSSIISAGGNQFSLEDYQKFFRYLNREHGLKISTMHKREDKSQTMGTWQNDDSIFPPSDQARTIYRSAQKRIMIDDLSSLTRNLEFNKNVDYPKDQRLWKLMIDMEILSEAFGLELKKCHDKQRSCQLSTNIYFLALRAQNILSSRPEILDYLSEDYKRELAGTLNQLIRAMEQDKSKHRSDGETKHAFEEIIHLLEIE